MKKLSIYCALVALLFAGCQTSSHYYLNPALKTYSRATLEKVSPIKLPPNWNADNFKKIVLGVHITDGGKELDRTLNTRLQTEIDKLKRFQVYSAYNVDGKMMFMDLADVGEAEMKEPTKQPELNYILNIKLTMRRSARVEPSRGMKFFRYEAVCDWNLEDLAERTIAESGVAKGVTERLQYVSPGMIPLSGFFPEMGDEEARCSAALKAIAVVANRIGNRFPVGGEIKGVSQSGERLTLDKGFGHGIGKFHQVAVCARVGRSGKVSIPIALAEAMPTPSDSNLHIYRWNRDNPDAEIVVKEYLADPRAYAKTHKLFAVGYGIPIPPEWEDDSTEADERVRLERKR